MDRIVEIWEQDATEIPQFETSLYDLRRSFNRSADKLDWYERLLTKIQNMNIKKKALAIVIPLMMSVGISQAEIINRTNNIDNSSTEYVQSFMEGDKSVSRYQVYFDTTMLLRDGTPDNMFEKTVDHNGTDLYFKLSKRGPSTGDIVVTLNGNEIYKDDNGVKLSQADFDTTIIANKGDVFKVIISDGGKCDLDVKMSADIATGIEDVEDVKFKIYPNPAISTLNIQLEDNSKEYTYEIYDISGKLVVPQGKLRDMNTSIDVSKLSRGHYIIKLISDDGSYSKRFIKN